MMRFIQILKIFSLIGILLPAILVFNGKISEEGMKQAMLIATVLWFALSVAALKVRKKQ